METFILSIQFDYFILALVVVGFILFTLFSRSQYKKLADIEARDRVVYQAEKQKLADSLKADPFYIDEKQAMYLVGRIEATKTDIPCPYKRMKAISTTLDIIISKTITSGLGLFDAATEILKDR